MLELELKLICEDNFKPEPLLSELRKLSKVSRAQEISQVDTYWDTRTQSLAKAGVSARIRVKGDSAKVQFKVVPLIPEVVMGRTEIGCALPQGRAEGPSVRQLAEKEMPIKLRGVPVEQLRLNTTRRKHTIDFEGCVAELCLDQVQVKARSGTEKAFAELELELVSGNKDSFHTLADSISGYPGLLPSKQSKYLRSRKLLNLPAVSFGAPKPQFGATDSIDDVARSILAAQVQAMRSYEAGTHVGLDIEQLHKMRVATRRIRAALKLFRVCFTQRDYEYLDRGYRWLAAALGEVRDLDVQQFRLEELRQQLASESHPKGWERLAEVLREDWAGARQRMLKAVDSERYQQLVNRSDVLFGRTPRRLTSHPGREPIGTAALALVEKRVRQFKKAFKRARRTRRAADVHELRIVTKRVRYTCEFLAPVLGERFIRRAKRLGVFQDKLGYLQDNEVTGDLARKLMLREQDANAEYTYVLGMLAGFGTGSQLGAAAIAEEALADLGGMDQVNGLVRMAERLKRRTARTLKAES